MGATFFVIKPCETPWETRRVPGIGCGNATLVETILASVWLEALESATVIAGGAGCTAFATWGVRALVLTTKGLGTTVIFGSGFSGSSCTSMLSGCEFVVARGGATGLGSAASVSGFGVRGSAW